jgi:hypothetical protein
VVEKGTVTAVKGKKNVYSTTATQSAYGSYTSELTLAADGTSFTMPDDVGGDVTYVKSARKD